MLTPIGLTDVGDFEYWKIKTVLEAIDSPTQLHLIETNSPQIRGEDAELWQVFVARDIPKWQEKNYAPRNPLNWHKVYKKYKREQGEEIRRDEEVLMASLAGIKKERAVNVTQLVDIKSLPKMPRDPKMQFNAGIKIGRRGFKKDTPSSLVWTAGSKTKLTDGKSVLTRARREAKEISQRSKLAKPTHQLSGRISQIKKAPAGMVNEYRRAVEPPLRILARKRNPVAQLPENGPSLEERERRLKALTSSKKYSTPIEATIVSSDSDEEDSIDDPFDEPSRSAASSYSSRPRSTTSSTHSRPNVAARPSRPAQSIERERQYPPSSSPSSSNLKPSDFISSILRKPKPEPQSAAAPSITSRGSSPANFRRSPSPGHGERKLPMIQRKKPQVDVFNRKVKRPRTG
jgi:elongin-A